MMTTIPTNTFLELIDMVTVLRQIQYFSDLNEEQLNILAKACELKYKAKNKFIYQDGDKNDKVYILINGTVKLGSLSVDNKEVIKSILHPRSLFGESSISKEMIRGSFAKSIDVDVRYLEIDVQVFLKLMKENFEFNLKIVEHLGRKIQRTEKRIESLVFYNARTRIVDFIKDNAKNFGQKVGLETLLKHSLTQQDIANFTGTSRQTVTSVLNELKSTNKIHFKRKRILIRDLETLL